MDLMKIKSNKLIKGFNMKAKLDQFIDTLAKLDLYPFGYNQASDANNLPLILMGLDTLNTDNEDTHDNTHTNSVYV